MRQAVIAAVILALAVGAWWVISRDSIDGTAREQAPRATPVLVQRAQRQMYSDEIEALGTTRAAESVDLTARVSNVITAIRFQEGQRVERGAVLVELESSEARANLAAAEATLVESRSQFERSSELLRTNAVSPSHVEQLQAKMRADEAALAAARARVQDHQIRAPFAGRVGLRRVSVGTLVTPGTVITTLDDVSTVLLDFMVPETYLSALRPGQTLTARSAAFPDRVVEGVVTTIDSRVDPVTRSVEVRARIANADDLLRPGMFMTVRVLREQAPLLLVPEQALVPAQRRQYLYVVVDGVVEEREVRTGRRAPGRVEIVEGLDEGETFVVEGTQRVREGTRVQPRPWSEARL